MIYSIGIDLVQTGRVRRAIEQWGESFASKILGEKEMGLYNAKHNKIPFLSGRFAAKEAVIKTLGACFDERVFFRQIQILNDPQGKPYVLLEDIVKNKIPGKGIMISITHEREMAAAVAILIGD
jgi:holo-[acyl-carrier protein] synthase